MVGCWIGQWTCPNYERSVSSGDRPGLNWQHLFHIHQVVLQHRLLVYLTNVYIQGTIVDRIDYNVQNVASTVEEGLKQLQKVSLWFLLCILLIRRLSSFTVWFVISFNVFLIRAVISCNVMLGLIGLQAERSQKQGGMVMCATALVIMCFIMLVLLILKEILFWFMKIFSTNFA